MSDPGYDWRVVVSPARGTVSPAEVAEGSRLPAGSPLGRIRSRREEVDVSAAYDGVLAEWLVHEGDLVDAGDPIARLYPEVVRMTTIQLPAGAPGRPHPRASGAYRPAPAGDQRRARPDRWTPTTSGSRPGSASPSGAGRPRTRPSSRWPSPPAARRIAASGLAPDEIDLVIVASASLRAPIPGIGPVTTMRYSKRRSMLAWIQQVGQ